MVLRACIKIARVNGQVAHSTPSPRYYNQQLVSSRPTIILVYPTYNNEDSMRGVYCLLSRLLNTISDFVSTQVQVLLDGRPCGRFGAVVYSHELGGE